MKNKLPIGKLWLGQLEKIIRKKKTFYVLDTSLDSWINWLCIEIKMDKTLPWIIIHPNVIHTFSI